ncbi:MAG TPA: hypothetical protein HPP87_10480 [Planctomycetes bacterium]|nr:hypothetical protein [Planctomycetota bacterium]
MKKLLLILMVLWFLNICFADFTSDSTSFTSAVSELTKEQVEVLDYWSVKELVPDQKLTVAKSRQLVREAVRQKEIEQDLADLMFLKNFIDSLKEKQQILDRYKIKAIECEL